MSDDMKSEATAAAALAICESLLISLRERGILSAEEIKGLLSDAASAHRHRCDELSDQAVVDLHVQAAGLIERIRENTNSVPD